jgi:hypothetical protein
MIMDKFFFYSKKSRPGTQKGVVIKRIKKKSVCMKQLVKKRNIVFQKKKSIIPKVWMNTSYIRMYVCRYNV